MSSASAALGAITLPSDAYIALMEKCIGEAKTVQNNPPSLVPREDNVVRHLLEVLKPHMIENGGPLKVEAVAYTEGRSNLLIEYPGSNPDKHVSFVGSHLDVVTANPETWKVNPFALTVDGDKLYGRGTTDCLGHVCLITLLFVELAKSGVKLEETVHAVFIASEEFGIAGVGIDGLLEHGRLEEVKKGPMFWVDCSDSQPCIGTAGAIMWHLKVDGHLFHSGFPNKGINALELAMEATKVIQDRFYVDFPPHELEEKYQFMTPSTMKPTRISVPPGGLNQIPPECTVSGDVRLTPFYKVDDVKAALERYVKEINDNFGVEGKDLPYRGPMSRYVLPEKKAVVRIEWAEMSLSGIACNLESPGFKAICEATRRVKGEVKPFSVCGSLPLVGELAAMGCDLQLCGFGKSAVYHGDNEYCLLSDMQDAIKILANVIDVTNAGSA